MNIGIDIDGVLIEFERYELDVLSKAYYLNHRKRIENPTAHGSFEIFKGTKEQDDNLWSKAVYDYIKEPPRRFAKEVIDLLKKDGHTISIVTNRTNDLSYVPQMSKDFMKKSVKRWLKKHKIYYDNLIFSTGDKTTQIKENKIDIMIEDSPQKICAISNLIPVIAYDSLYNHNLEGENILRAYSWYDIYRLLKELNSNLHFAKITKQNFNLAVKIQKEIFPHSDASYNYMEAIEKIPYRKELECWIVYNKETPIGVCGIYSLLEYPEDAWVSWFGILKEYRGHKYGFKILKMFEDEAIKRGYKNMHLYTDKISNKTAIKLYQNFGMIGEMYENKKEKHFNKLTKRTMIFSKPLTNKKCPKWKNKYLDISANIDKEETGFKY